LRPSAHDLNRQRSQFLNAMLELPAANFILKIPVTARLLLNEEDSDG